MEFVAVTFFIAYVVPFTVAASRDHPRLYWILAMNLALGWTGIGWWVSLAWSLTVPDGRVSRHWPWLHPRPPGRARRRRFRVLNGGQGVQSTVPARESRVAADGTSRH